MTARVRWLPMLLVAAVPIVGCGQAELWTRYQAEREFWSARRIVERIQVNPRLATAADYDRALAAFRRIVTLFPADPWAAPERVRGSVARDIATISGNARIAMGRLEAMRGRLEPALAHLEAARVEYRTVMPVSLKAALAAARTLEEAGDTTRATTAYAAINRDFPMFDPVSHEVVRPVLDAPFRVASDLRRAGHPTAADSVLREAEARLVVEIRRGPTPPVAPELWLRLGRARAMQGQERLDQALDALRRALNQEQVGDLKPRIVLWLAEYSLAGGRADSALRYTRWAQREFGPLVQLQALLYEGRVWEATSPESAIAVYGRFLEKYPAAMEAGSMARYRRGYLLEQLDRWELARTEYRALSASHPTDPLAFESVERIVAHHLRRGERQLGAIEAQRAVESLERMIATNRDEGIQLRARQTRARLLLATESYGPAVDALAELWSRYGQLPIGVSAGFHAAQVAENQLRDRARALQLYRDLADRAGRPADQRMARMQAERLQRGQG